MKQISSNWSNIYIFIQKLYISNPLMASESFANLVWIRVHLLQARKLFTGFSTRQMSKVWGSSQHSSFSYPWNILIYNQVSSTPFAPHITIFIKKPKKSAIDEKSKKIKKQEWRKLNKKLEEMKNFLIFTYIFSSAVAVERVYTYTHDNQRLLKNVIRYF